MKNQVVKSNKSKRKPLFIEKVQQFENDLTEPYNRCPAFERCNKAVLEMFECTNDYIQKVSPNGEDNRNLSNEFADGIKNERAKVERFISGEVNAIKYMDRRYILSELSRLKSLVYSPFLVKEGNSYKVNIGTLDMLGSS